MNRDNITLGLEIICIDTFINTKYYLDTDIIHTKGTRFKVHELESKLEFGSIPGNYVLMTDIEREHQYKEGIIDNHYRYHISDKELVCFESKIDRVRRIINEYK